MLTFFFFKLFIGDNWLPLHIQVLYKVAKAMPKNMKEEKINKDERIFFALNKLEIVTCGEKLRTHFVLAVVHSMNLSYTS